MSFNFHNPDIEVWLGLMVKELFKKKIRTLAGVAQWIECQPVNQKVAGSVPSQGTERLWGQSPVGDVRGNHTSMFLSLSLPAPLSKNK